ncbi:DNA-processing protein DprA [Nocardia nova]|uniref:DNA-processing protein DprA n=1 Tax=Nocardia nova TaxID=37330 RepID=UPI001C44BA20|nr:DNA-processing protein DprA [Nocardia nova]
MRLLWQSKPVSEIADRIRRVHTGFPTPSDLGDLARRDVDRLNELTTLGWNVVASSAYGVAAIAHKAALAAHGHPVAVLAAGIDVAHPPGYSGLLATIATSGLFGIRIPARYIGDPGPSPRPVSPVGRAVVGRADYRVHTRR